MDASLRRLREVPWRALFGLAPSLAAPLAEVLAGAPAERVLDRFLRAHRGLGADGRAVAAEAVFGVGLWRRRLRAAAGDETAPPLVLLGLLVRDLGGVENAAALVGLPAEGLPPPDAAPSALADRWSLPDWLAAIVVREAGPEAEDLAAALDRPGPVCLRANGLRIGRDALAARLAAEGVAVRPGRFAPAALVLEAPRANLLGLRSWREGLFEVQDEGSQLLAAILEARPGETALDFCAGAGGKTLALAADVGPAGSVHATDPDGERLARLAMRAARAGAANVRVQGAAAPPDLLAHRVLVDAPCSELGSLRRGPDQRWRIDPATFSALPALQLAILERAAGHVREGGRLVYATCTIRREENEDVALAFAARHPCFARVRPAVDPALLTGEGFLRTWPHRHGTDGFFGAAWERRGW